MEQLQKDGRSFKGSPYCKRGHLKTAGQRNCGECNKIRCAKHLQLNREQHRLNASEWYYGNREYALERNRKYREDNGEAVAAKQKEWRQRNREKINAYFRERYASDATRRAKHREIMLRWRERNPEIYRQLSVESKNRRRARLRGCTEHHTRAEWLAMVEAYGGRCAYCGKDGRLERDHIKPLSRGGHDSIDNIQPLCRGCNLKKGCKT
jgi:5-methylcytosine-specific restriction endonuclease McrA